MVWNIYEHKPFKFTGRKGQYQVIDRKSKKDLGIVWEASVRRVGRDWRRQDGGLNSEGQLQNYTSRNAAAQALYDARIAEGFIIV